MKTNTHAPLDPELFEAIKAVYVAPAKLVKLVKSPAMSLPALPARVIAAPPAEVTMVNASPPIAN